MKQLDGRLQLSASDLVGHLNCDHLTALNVQVATGALSKPDYYDPLLEILRERGFKHEQAYIEYLESEGLNAIRIDGVDITDDAVTATLDAMSAGAQLIIQAALRNDRWSGRADILIRVDKPSKFGNWSYEVVDTKLARETKGGTVLQLSLYADLLTAAQGAEPENIHVVSPWSDFEPQTYRVADFAAYYRHVRGTAESATQVGDNTPAQTYPDPKAHCDVCRWSSQCDNRRRDDDHLCLVANITKNQINELQANGITTMKGLADAPVPLPFQPQRGSVASLEKVQAQAAIQVLAREKGALQIEFLDLISGVGFEALPKPSDGDVFFDIESDQFVGEHGLEYLLGYATKNDDGQTQYYCEWALDRETEKLAFERFVDFVTDRRAKYPDMHVYHFAPYEPAALKRLMGRYATRETEIDNLLRGLVFVDLLAVVRNALRASVESYSLKKLEPFFNFQRQVTLHDANVALTRLSSELELNDVAAIDEETRAIVQGYNADDCFSTASLRDWLEELRAQRIGDGVAINRPEPGQDGPSEELSDQVQRIQELITRLTHDVPADPEERTREQHARWILAYLLEWHRREDKATWWEYFRLSDLTADELLQERAALSGLALVETIETTKRGIPTHRYRFELQDTDIRGGEALKQVGGESLGTVVAIAPNDRTVDIKKSAATKDIHPEAVFAHQVIGTAEQAASLFRMGEYVAEHGIEGEGPYRSGRELLLRNAPNLNGQTIQEEGEITLDAALRLTQQLEYGVLPIQGPPGTGKSFTGAHMICELVKQGKTVGITANSHKVIRNLLDKVIDVAEKSKIPLHCIQKPKEPEPNTPQLTFVKTNDALFNALSEGSAQVAGATHFLWSRLEAQDTLDVLVVDEAAQMSLANVVAVSPAAKIVILLGDPQQLEQPMQGSHPDGTDASSLEHILGEHQTIQPDQGLFLETTWRLHPEICAYNSELFYESKLDAMPDCVDQTVRSDGPISGHGIRYLPVTHTGNTNASIEEAEAVLELVNRILADSSTWVNREGEEAPITLDDILIIAPYNAQVFEIQQLLPNARVGTVDKFQGQEAPIAIFSMATSSFADAPRGMEFLYSPNRLNVAISRAKCMAILVASPYVFDAECRTPRQMQLANAFCRYLEMSQMMSMPSS
ncbi:TM0106 family RecB-like putative nuclease [Marinobacterium sp. MBR-109]|jgi:uncharacterized protein|uniref:TM0106 family RecB-like putative nuclease n=1 Tax=Marinobacterium sp. MBR-109 TaxID=3156462 RepID=UPI00339217F4